MKATDKNTNKFNEKLAEFNRTGHNEIWQNKEYYYKSLKHGDGCKELRLYKKSGRIVSSKKETPHPELVEFTRINNDVNGNPRYVCHFLNFVKSDYSKEGIGLTIEQKYARALFLAKKLGGRKFHNKQYGGGIVFQSYNIQGLSKNIYELMLNS